MRLRDHPRSRGEYFHARFHDPGTSGSSPLSRGILTIPAQSIQVFGIIPALAGNTGQPQTIPEDLPDHPRSRGEYHGRGAAEYPG